MTSNFAFFSGVQHNQANITNDPIAELYFEKFSRIFHHVKTPVIKSTVDCFYVLRHNGFKTIFNSSGSVVTGIKIKLLVILTVDVKTVTAKKISASGHHWSHGGGLRYIIILHSKAARTKEPKDVRWSGAVKKLSVLAKCWLALRGFQEVSRIEIWETSCNSRVNLGIDHSNNCPLQATIFRYWAVGRILTMRNTSLVWNISRQAYTPQLSDSASSR